MVMKREQSGVYTLSSVVLPNNNLMRTGTIIKTIDSTIYDANFQMVRKTQRLSFQKIIEYLHCNTCYGC